MYFADIARQRQSLPAFTARKNLIANVKHHSTIILIGETACGKTTQVPQFLHEEKIERNGMIGITQPRRVAAVTIAERVSVETGTELGKLVGYTVRFDDTTSEETKMKYMTDGMLLREAMLDPLLKKYSIIILDEAHERTIHTDVLFGVVKHAQESRTFGPKLKIIIMSATMNVDKFSQYFSNAPVFYLEGRQFHVEILNLEQSEPDYVFAALRATFQVHQSQDSGDILIFCTGQEEIESMAKKIRETSKHLSSNFKRVQVCPLYAALPSSDQLQVFMKAQNGCRKIILATNIAETSLTIPGIKFVIDTGMVKARIYNPSTGLSLLKVQKISKAQAWQRSGRAGRQSSGKCFRLYTEQDYETMRLQTIPEIQRCNLSGVVLELVAIGIKNLANFDFMDKPSEKAINKAIVDLQLLGALEEGKQTKVSVFTLNRYIIALEEVLSIISMLSVESIFFSPAYQKEYVNTIRNRYSSSEGDLITLLNVFRAYKSVNKKKEWCKENYIHHRNIKMAIEVKKQLVEVCQNVKIPLKSCGQDTIPIRKCFATGMLKNTAEICPDGTYVALDTHYKTSIHPSSCLFKCKPAYVVFAEMVKTSKCYIRELCVVDPDWLSDAAPTYFKNKFRFTKR
ncbi:ATP-dependent RNA helicase DHX33 [Nymphon striatum]|nr:ATP-dependent RNA helicase DHX33 [Nymphon striatum]